MTTGMASFTPVVMPLIPATNVVSWLPRSPMRRVLASPAIPGWPMQMLLSPVVRAGRVREQRQETSGRIFDANRVGTKGARSAGRVLASGRVEVERTNAVGRILKAGRVGPQGGLAHGRVVGSGQVGLKCIAAD